MKKLMIAAAAAAMIGGAFADAQVYEYKLNLTTTACKQGKVTKNSYWTKLDDTHADYKEVGDIIMYRAKSSIVLQGLTWGCSCAEALAGQWDYVCSNQTDPNWFGITFWNKKADEFLGGYYNATMFTWDFINRIGKKGTDVEFSLTLEPDSGVTSDEFSLKLAGIGTIVDTITDGDFSQDGDKDDCKSYIKSAKGSVAGYSILTDYWNDCTYCDETGVDCEYYAFCDQACCSHNFFDKAAGDETVAFGTFTMKYNASASKKLKTAKDGRITNAYTGFSKAVKAELVLAGE